MLLLNEKVLADRGYSGPYIVHDSLVNDPYGQRAALYRAAHERVNGRVKNFNCLQNRFRHDIKKHRLCLSAIANILQIEFEIQS